MDFTQAYNRPIWQNFLEDSFLPDDFRRTEDSIPYSGNYTKNVTRLGECPSLQLAVFEIKHSSVNDARVGLSKEAFTLVRDYTKYNRALALFVPQSSNDSYRFSYVEFTPVLDDAGKIKRNYTNPRRYSYILGKNAKVRTPQQYLQKKEAVKDAIELKGRFSVEVLTKEFYKNLFDWYDKWAIDVVEFPNGTGRDVTLEKGEQNRIHLIRLITRFIFVWFIKQKKLIPDWIFDKNEVGKILKNFKSDSLDSGNYYNGIIQNLFFATLNKPINEREFAYEKANERKEDYGIKTKFRDTINESLFAVNKKDFISLFDSIPFLNGGLFECLDNFDTKEYIDGFSREKNRRAFIPNALFWGKDGKTGLIELFNTYNFTIEENTPQDIDVALDPELLGKAFENLLGTYNEETSSTARNESGSFYTPREIVDYMVDTSLKEYLKGKLDSKDAEEKLSSLFSYDKEGHDFDAGQAKIIMDAIHKCKILDPACGSGAFPMGILNKLAFIMHKLDPKNEIWRGLQIDKATEENKKAYSIDNKENRKKRLNEINEIFEMSIGEYSNYARKLFLIENCIYGVDIQPIAIQISKLRFFISLIVDQKTGKEIANNYNVLPLPNLETKFVAANTLIGVKQKQGVLLDIEIAKKQEELLIIRHNHFTAREAKEKITLRKQDDNLCKELAVLLKKGDVFTSAEIDKLLRWNPYNQTVPSEIFDAYWMFGVSNGFDVVIGNPPYIQLQNNQGKLADMYSTAEYKCFSRSGDIYQIFYECGYKLLSDNGHLCFITSNKWMRSAYGEKTRNFFATKANPKLLIDFAGQRVFETATVDVNIILVQKAKNQQHTHSCIIKEECKSNMTNYIKQHGSALEFTSGSSWVILNPIEKRIKDKIENIGTPLRDWDISINYGIKTGCNEAFIIDKSKRNELIAKDKKSAEIIRPILRGRDIKRYGYEFAEQYIIATFPSRKYDINDYPAVRDYFLEFGKKRLEQSGKPGARKKTSHKWFETQDPIAYWEDFSKQKIIYPDIMRMPRNTNLLKNYPYFYFDKNNFYVEATNFILIGNNLELIFSFLVSDIGFYVFSKFYSGPQFDETGFRYKKEYMNNLYIPNISKNDNELLISIFNNNYPNSCVIDKTCEEIFIRSTGLIREEVEVIKQYKYSLLSTVK
uniref:site-specific DNA-methyltransferase (adenine-specific) n=1 Tax=uncultured bacterium contig00013 TaxID=1181504 RepID=A0A806KF85_9BACT|nr:putative type IIS restriction/modification enzyme [uncultured bacterium contig00013]